MAVRDKHITVRVTREESDGIAAAAKAAGVSKSDWILTRLLGPEPVGPPRSHPPCPEHPDAGVEASRGDDGLWWRCTECRRVLR